MAGGTRVCINLITSDRKQSSVAKLFMMKSATVRMVCSQLGQIASFTEVSCTCLYSDL
jgi:hypothetical protein